MANIITGSRILLSMFLLFSPVFSLSFYVFYICAGLTDMIDGTVARLTHGESDFGSKLDTTADIVFTFVCALRILPNISLPCIYWIGIAIVALIKLLNIAAGFVIRREFTSVHSIMNKITGVLLFIFPLTLTRIDIEYSAAVLIFVAFCAATQESILIFRRQ